MLRKKRRLLLEVEELEERLTPADISIGVPAAGGTSGLPNIGLTQSIGYAAQSQPVVIASLDTGVDFANPLIAQHIWINQAAVPGSVRAVLGNGLITFATLDNNLALLPGLDHGNKGYIDAADLLKPIAQGGWSTGPSDDLVGWNFVNNSNDPFDDNGHGTYQASILAAVDPNVLIMPVKVLDATGAGTFADVTAGLDFALANGAQVISDAWTADSVSSAWEAALQTALTAGAVVVTSAGDSDPTALTVLSQEKLANMVIVGASDGNNQLAPFSNAQPGLVDIAAPGVGITGAGLNGSSMTASGTSVSTAFAAATAALLEGGGTNPGYLNVIADLFAGAQQVPALGAGVTDGLLLDIAGALTQAGLLPSGHTPAGSGPGFLARDLLLAQLGGGSGSKQFGPWGSLGGGDVKQLATGTDPNGDTELFGIGLPSPPPVPGLRGIPQPTPPWAPLYVNVQSTPNGSYGGWQPLGGLVSQIVVGTEADGTLVVFGIGTDNAAWFRQQQNNSGTLSWTPWQSLGGYVKQLAVGTDAAGNLELFGIGGDNAVWVIVQNGNNASTFGGWNSLGGYVTQITVANNQNGSLTVFGIGGDHAAWFRQQTSGTFSTWASLGGYVQQLTAGRDAQGNLELFGIGGDNAAWVIVQSGNNALTYGTWNSLGGYVTQLVVGQNLDGTLELVGIGGDHAAWVKKQTSPSGSAFDAFWTSLGGYVKQLALGTDQDLALSLSGIGSDNAAWLSTQG